MNRWLARLRHDLIKHAVWPARDLRDVIAAGRAARSSDGAALRRALLELPGADGQPVGILAAWHALRAELDSPSAQQRVALDRFESEVDALQRRAADCSEASDGALHAPALCDAVLALDAAFETLAHDVKPRA